MVNPILEQAASNAATSKPTATEIPATPTQPVSEKVPAPEASSISVIEAAIAETSAATTNAITRAEERVTSTNEATNAVVDALGQRAAAQKTIALTRDTANLQEQNANAAIFAAAGGTDMQVALMTEVSQEASQLESLTDKRADIMDDKHTGLSVLDAVINGFRSISTNIQIKQKQKQVAGTLDQVRTITGTQEAFAKQNALVKQTTNNASIEAHQREIESIAQVEIEKARLVNLHSNADAVNSLLNMKSTQVSQLIQSYRLEGEEANREMQVKRHEFAVKEMDFAQEKWKVQFSAATVALEQAQIQLEETKLLTGDRRLAAEANYRSKVKEYNDMVNLQRQMTSSVQNAQALAGLPVEDDETIVWRLQREDPVYMRLRNVGAATLDGDPLVLGRSPAEANDTINIIDPNRRIPETKGTKLLDAIRKLQFNKYAEAGGAPKDAKVRTADFNATADQLVAGLSANITPDSPFAAPNMQVMDQLLSGSGVALYDKVLKPMGMQEVDPQRIVDTALNAAFAGTISPEEAAAGITSFFEHAASYNNTQDGGFARVGLPNQETYKTSLKRPAITAGEIFSVNPTSLALSIAGTVLTGGEPTEDQIEGLGFIQTEDVDLMDETQVQLFVIKLLSGETAAKASSGKEEIQ